MQSGWMLLIPVLLPLIAAPLAYGVGRKHAPLSVTVMSLISAFCLIAIGWLFWQTQHGVFTVCTVDGIMGMTLRFCLDGFRALYALIAGFMWLCSSLFSHQYLHHEQNVPRYAAFTLLTLSATLGIFFADNLLTVFLFFEIMSLSSYPWVAHSETPEALRAAETYLYIALIGGLCILMGLFLLPEELLYGTLGALPEMAEALTPDVLWLPCGLMLIGFGAKAGAFPLHVWLPKAHPVAPAPASALLSGMLTKTGIFGILVLTSKLMLHNEAWGMLLFWLGVVTMLVGALLALLSNNLKRVLASSSLSQIGFILLGIGLCNLLGEENGLAAWGTVTHMVNHSLFKLLLFLCAGVVTMNIHAMDLDSARGFGRHKPLLHIAFLFGLLGISGIPLFSGYASKSLLHEALTEYIVLLDQSGLSSTAYQLAEWLFLCTGGLTLAYMLKVYVCLFWQRNPSRQKEYNGMKRYLTPLSGAVLLFCALLPLLLGIFPNPLMSGIGSLSSEFLLAGNVEPVDYFSTANILGACKAFVIGVAVYGLIVRPLISRRTRDGYHEYPNRKPAWLDLEDSVYRPLISLFVSMGLILARFLERFVDAPLAWLRRALHHRREKPATVPGGNRLTYLIGSMLDIFVKVLNYTLWRKRPVQPTFVYALAAGNEELRRQTHRLTRSISFSLLMVCLGLFATLAYLLLF